MNLLVFPGVESIFAFLAFEILSRNERKLAMDGIVYGECGLLGL
jgi:hypothetical protein